MRDNASKCSQGQPANSTDAIEVKVEARAFLRISAADASGDVFASLARGASWIRGETIATFLGSVSGRYSADGRSDIRIALPYGDYGDSAKPRLWFGRSAIPIPPEAMQRIADFLHLDIPQPELPAGQEVPR